MSGGSVNPTEMVAALINQKDNMIEGIRYAQEVIEGSMTMLILTPKGILAARDRLGRTPLIVGKKEDACCVSFESFAYLNLGYEDLKELGPGEIVAVTPDGVETLQKPGEEMRICSFLWVYYGYPTSAYEGVNVEEMRYHCGDMLARRDRGEVNPDIVAGFRYCPCYRICEPVRCTFCPSVYQIYTNLAKIIYAYTAEPEKSYRKNETDSCAPSDQG